MALTGGALSGRLADFGASIVYAFAYDTIGHLSKSLVVPSVGVFLRVFPAFLMFAPWLCRRTPRSEEKPSVCSGEDLEIESLLSQTDDFREPPTNTDRVVGLWSLFAGLLFGIGLIAMNIALAEESSMKVALWINLYVVLIPVIQSFYRTSVTGTTLIAGILCLSGICLYESNQFHTTAGLFSTGTMAGAMTAVCFAASYLILDNAVELQPDETFRITAFLFMGALVAPFVAVIWDFAAIWEGSDFETVLDKLMDIEMAFHDPMNLFCFFFSGPVATGLTALTEIFALSRISASEHTILLQTQLFWIGLFHSIQTRTPLDKNFFMGAGLCFVAVALCQLAPAPLRKNSRDCFKRADKVDRPR